MAVSIDTGRRSSFQDRNFVKLNIEDRLDFLTPTDLPFLSYLGVMSDANGGATMGANTLRFPCTQQKHQWNSDELVPNIASVGSAYTATGGSLVVATGEGDYFDVGDVIMVNDMVAIVTQVSTDTLTITELHNSSNAAVGDKVHIMEKALVEGTAASSITARSTNFSSLENYTQIFMDKIDITGTEMSTERYGIMGDPLEFQTNKKLKELAIKLEKTAIYGRRNDTYPANNSTPRRMGGLAHYVRDNSDAIVTSAAGNDLDQVYLNDLLEDIWAAGGQPDTIMVPARQKRMISSLLEPAVRVPRTESTVGVVVGAYESDFGVLNVVMNRWMKPSDLIVLTSGEIGIGPLTGNGNSRAFFIEDLPKDGDYHRRLMTGEYTMEVHNPTKCFGWLEDLSTS